MSGITNLFDKQPRAMRGSEEAAMEMAKNRPESETHITKRPDRIKQYLIHRMKDFTFDEFSPEYLDKIGMGKELSGVPIPLRDEDREGFKENGSLPSTLLAENMMRVVGIDPGFKYQKAYTIFIDKLFGQKAVDNTTRKAKDYADREDYETACIYFRAGLVQKFNDLAAMYGYARILRQLYSEGAEKGRKEEYTGTLKAECLCYFEMTTEFYPKFDMGWYYLGYMYLNLGLYVKAKLAWQEYLKVGGRILKDRREIAKRLGQLKDPVEIEKGYNAVLSGRWSKGIDILEPYTESKFNDWWPLWYYLGVAYARTGREDEAVKAFKEALKGSPRHIESMEELVDLYNKLGDKTNTKKYRDKLTLINK